MNNLTRIPQEAIAACVHCVLAGQYPLLRQSPGSVGGQGHCNQRPATHRPRQTSADIRQWEVAAFEKVRLLCVLRRAEKDEEDN